MKVFAVWISLLAASVALAAEPEDEWLRTTAEVTPPRVPRGGTFRVNLVLEMDEGYHVNANPGSLDFLIPTEVAPEPHAPVEWGEVRYPEGVPLEVEWSDSGAIRVYEGRAVVSVPGEVAAEAPTGPMTVRLTLTYQACDASTCYQPASRTVEADFEVMPADFVPPETAPPDVTFEGETDVAGYYERGLPLYLAALFAGGLLLNLTPCVFPLIPVTMNLFAQQGESRTRKVLPLAILYVAGLAGTFTLVGVLAALAGQSLGLVLQSPWGVLGVVTVLAVMMASAFGAFEIQLPSNLAGRLGGQKGALGALVMGMVMGAVAAPCVGPFLIALIAFVAASGSILLGAASFLAVGTGLGLPYLFLGLSTSLLNRFPRSGGWLLWTKRLLGMALAGVILYFIEPYVAPAFFRPLVLAVFVFAAVYLGLLEGLSRRPFSPTFQVVRAMAAVAILGAGIAVYASANPDSDAAPEKTDARPQVAWEAWGPRSLDAARQARRPVLLYFTADWCAECRVWKAKVFSHPDVIATSDGLARIKVDVTRPPEGEKRVLAEKYRGVNPPAVILLGPGGEVVKAWRAPPSAAAFADTLRGI